MRLLPSTSIIFLLSFLVHLISLHASHPHTDPTKIICLDNEKEALLDFKLSFVVDHGPYIPSWSILSNDTCCNWEGVTCDDSRHVVMLNLGQRYLRSYQLRRSLQVLQHLTYLDLSYNVFPMRIPDFLGSLSKLKRLDLSSSGFYGVIPPHLGNLSNLESLYLGPSNHLWDNNLQWVSPLSSLSILDLSEVNLSNSTDWIYILKMLPSLMDFTCTSCSLPSPPLSFLAYVNSTYLHSLDLSSNAVSLSTFSSLINGSSNVGTITLNHMQLDDCTIYGILEVLSSWARDSLEHLSLVDNNLNTLPFEGVMFPSLVSLDVSYNRLNDSSLKDLQTLTSLNSLDMSFNKLKSSFPRILQYLPKNSTRLEFSSNFIHGVLADEHLSNFSRLKGLRLSHNNLLMVNFSKNWVAPFQLHALHLGSCMIGPSFLNWILTQKLLRDLDISNSMTSGVILDTAFWKFSTRLSYLNVSHNRIAGKIPNLPLPYEESLSIDLSNNAFYGTIPLYLFTSFTLDLSHNMFSNLPLSCNRLLIDTPVEINLSNNRLSGSLPKWLFRFDSPRKLNLANNMLSGTLPGEIGSLLQLFVLHLGNNNFSGRLPSSMKNCTKLNILELGSNSFSGTVPLWIGETMSRLIVLNLRSNRFSGDFPSTLCHLQSLQILDLSENQISGPIPRCIHNFSVMSTNKDWSLMGMIGDKLTYSYENGYIVVLDYASVMWKGEMEDLYTKSLDQRSVINLSGNMLRGQIPVGVTALKDLRSLDLSRNGLTGSIPDQIGQMKLLEFLNLSSNRLSGELPKSLDDLTFLGTLDLSNNNLSGRIPSGTQLQGFDASSYAGNPKLCGEPVSINCLGDEDGDTIQPLSKNKKDDYNESFDIQAFLAALGTGFAFGLLGVIGMMHYNRRFRVYLFHSVHNIVEIIIVTTYVYHSKIKRSLFFNKEAR